MPSCLGAELFTQCVVLHYSYHFPFKCTSQSWSLHLIFRVYILPASFLLFGESSQPTVSWFRFHSCLLQTVVAIFLTWRRRGRVKRSWRGSCSWSVCYSIMGWAQEGWDDSGGRAGTEQDTSRLFLRCKALSRGVTEMGSIIACLWNVPYRLMGYSLGLQLGNVLRGYGNFRRDGESRRLGAGPWQCLLPDPRV